MDFRYVVATVCALCFSVSTIHAATVTVLDFEEFDLAGNLSLGAGTSFVSRGYQLDGGGQFMLFNSSSHPNISDSGSQSLLVPAAFGQSSVLSITETSGADFDLLNFRVGEAYPIASINNATQIEVTGFYSSGGSVNSIFGLDGTFDPDFESFSLSSAFTGLSSVTFTGLFPVGNRRGEFNIDDINLQLTEIAPVPLPAAAWLFASALGVFGYLGKRKAAA